MGLREANQHFSKAIRAVNAGEEVVLTERGKPIAVIKPFHGDQWETSLDRMAAAGLLIRATKPGPMSSFRLEDPGQAAVGNAPEERDER